MWREVLYKPRMHHHMAWGTPGLPRTSEASGSVTFLQMLTSELPAPFLELVQPQQCCSLGTVQCLSAEVFKGFRIESHF